MILVLITTMFSMCFGLFIPIFWLYSHILVNFVTWLSSMRLNMFNEGSIQISSQMLAKIFRKSYFGV